MVPELGNRPHTCLAILAPGPHPPPPSSPPRFRPPPSPLGVLWGALASQGVFLGVTLASILLPWDAGGRFWGTLASQAELGLTLGQKGRPLQSKWGSSSAPAHRIKPRGTHARNPEFSELGSGILGILGTLGTCPPKWRKPRSSQPSFTHAGG